MDANDLIKETEEKLINANEYLPFQQIVLKVMLNFIIKQV